MSLRVHANASHVQFETNGRALRAVEAPAEESGFVVLCDSAQGAIVETISQLFLPACDRPVGLMWEPCTPPPTANTPSPQCLRLSQQEGKVSARLWHQNKSERAKMAGERIESSPKYTRWH